MKKSIKKPVKKSLSGLKNLKKIFADADKSGLNWYKEANEFCGNVSAEYNISIETVCGIVAALSPATNWEQNKRDAVNLIRSENGQLTDVKFTTYGQNVEKARKIFRGEIKPNEAFSLTTGPKTYNFFYNIYKPNDPAYVTIDRHAFRIATGKEYKAVTAKQYRELAEHYSKAAKALEILPNQLQAVVWVDYRVKQFTGTAYAHLLAE